MHVGVVPDALDRRKVMLATQTIMALFAAALAALAFAGLRVAWPIYLLAALSSAAACFDGPARQALIPNLVPREHLASAIGLNTLVFQFASVAGPTLAGPLIARPRDGARPPHHLDSPPRSPPGPGPRTPHTAPPAAPL